MRLIQEIIQFDHVKPATNMLLEYACSVAYKNRLGVVGTQAIKNRLGVVGKRALAVGDQLPDDGLGIVGNRVLAVGDQ